MAATTRRNIRLATIVEYSPHAHAHTPATNRKTSVIRQVAYG